ncbi:hypothetical protein PR003_g33796, partial [Phytophthora rubi]
MRVAHTRSLLARAFECIIAAAVTLTTGRRWLGRGVVLVSSSSPDGNLKPRRWSRHTDPGDVDETGSVAALNSLTRNNACGASCVLVTLRIWLSECTGCMAGTGCMAVGDCIVESSCIAVGGCMADPDRKVKVPVRAAPVPVLSF